MVRTSIALTALAVIAVTACSGQPRTSGEPGSGDGGRDISPESGLPQGGEPVDLDPANFTDQVTHPYWPMSPGTRWTYREIDEDATELQVVVTVTSETKEIANGITARVVRDTVTEEGEVVEDTFDWYAQDRDGNLWYLGEDTAEFEDGEVASTAGSWEAGVSGALAGVILPAEPTDDMTYREEYLEGHAEDNGEILSVEEQVLAPAGQFDDALLVKDTNALEPDVIEYKLYARDVGPVVAITISGGSDREELLKVEQVSADAAAAAGTTPLGES